MHSRKAISITAALALAAGILSVPGGTFARGAGGFAAHGPVFGFHPRVGGHRPFRPALHHAPARFGWQLRRWHQHRFGGRNRGDASAIYGGSAGSYPSDVTGTVPEGPAVYAPPLVPLPPAERIGCVSRGYDVPGESGGVAHIVVIRC
jgi:hypothetical protein